MNCFPNGLLRSSNPRIEQYRYWEKFNRKNNPNVQVQLHHVTINILFSRILSDGQIFFLFIEKGTLFFYVQKEDYWKWDATLLKTPKRYRLKDFLLGRKASNNLESHLNGLHPNPTLAGYPSVLTPHLCEMQDTKNLQNELCMMLSSSRNKKLPHFIAQFVFQLFIDGITNEKNFDGN